MNADKSVLDSNKKRYIDSRMIGSKSPLTIPAIIESFSSVPQIDAHDGSQHEQSRFERLDDELRDDRNAGILGR